MSGLVLPTLSQIKAWDTEHLSQAATFWNTAAEMWESSFDQVAGEISAPAGSPWLGVAAEAAQSRATTDRLTVRAAAGDLRGAAVVAKAAVADLEAAKRSALLTVGEAEAHRFVVGEDLSVTPRHAGVVFPAEFYARQAQAESYAAMIRGLALTLVTLDAEVARQITAATAGLEYLGTAAADDVHDPSIQLVDNRTFQQGPIYREPDIEPGRGGPGPGANAAAIREAIKNLPTGTRGNYLEVRDPEQLRRFADWATKGGQEFQPTNPYRDGRSMFRLPDGTIVSQGTSVKHGPTMDIKLPDGSDYRIHVNPRTGGGINVPPGALPEPIQPSRPGIPESVLRPPLAGSPQLVNPGGADSAPTVLPAVPPIISRPER
ncbi:hypothetical protein [Mycolicibacterium austroafricanum]|jgi:hypothetical protein|uniref:hypothetical protein n=1 Tax=Mycolicibacterium austroafricanum TaxID=39687 RepID=UPI0010573988|nr:hypothetical protein [Mycolicibacterium austroafricanum]